MVSRVVLLDAGPLGLVTNPSIPKHLAPQQRKCLRSR